MILAEADNNTMSKNGCSFTVMLKQKFMVMWVCWCGRFAVNKDSTDSISVLHPFDECSLWTTWILKPEGAESRPACSTLRGSSLMAERVKRLYNFCRQFF